MKYAWFSLYHGLRDHNSLIVPRFLSEHGCEIIATNGTARFFAENGIRARTASDIFPGTQFGETFVSYDERIARAILRNSTVPFFKERPHGEDGISFDLVCAVLTPYYERNVQDAGGTNVLTLAIAAEKPVIASPIDYELTLSWLKDGRGSAQKFSYGLARIAAYELTRYMLTVAHPGKRSPLGTQARFDDTPHMLKIDSGADHIRERLRELLKEEKEKKVA